jgi:SOS-response transcriptional repressor LexA
MYRANIDSQPIHEGDYVIVNGAKRTPRNGEYVVAIVDNLASIKKFLFDKWTSK